MRPSRIETFAVCINGGKNKRSSAPFEYSTEAREFCPPIAALSTLAGSTKACQYGSAPNKIITNPIIYDKQ